MIFKKLMVLMILIIPIGANGQMRGGVYSTEITPELGLHMYGYLPNRYSDGIEDPLYMRVLVLEAGERTFALVNYDLGRMFKMDRLKKLRERIKEETGIREVFFAATHTHSGPDITDYGDQPVWEKKVFDQTVEGVKSASQNLHPIKIGYGRGEADHTYNRRRINPEGKPEMMWENHDRIPLGPVDKTLGVVRIDDLNDKPIAILVNYACHPVIYGNDNRKYSGDYVSILCKEVGEKMAGNPVCFFLNGASGDINPYYAGSNAAVNARSRVEETGRSLALEVMAIAKNIETKVNLHQPSLVSEIKYYDVPPRYDLPELFNRLKGTEVERARIQRLTSQMDQGRYIIPLSVVLITPEIGWVGLPGEFWHKFQKDIKAESPLDFVMVSGHTNGEFGYFPPIEDAVIGGYGADGYEAYTGVGTGEMFVKESVVIFNKMLGKLKNLPRGYEDK